MSSVEKAYETQIANIQMKTGKTQSQLAAMVKNSGLTKHSEIRNMLMRELGLGHGDANALVHFVLDSDGERAAKAAGASADDVLDGIYTGGKAHLRPIHDKLMAEIVKFGEFEIAPKKGYVSLRRKKQFAMIGPATNSRVEVGLNIKTLDASPRIIALPAGGMCNFKVNVSDPKEVDAELIGWARRAFDSAA